MSPSDTLVGQVLDKKYRIDKPLGRGAMGTVYLATHLGTGRLVAVKLIAPQFMANEEFVERFKREARAAGLLRHPNIVDVTDFGFTRSGSDRLAYLVMEYLDGISLAAVLKEEKEPPLSWVVDILEQVCLAVDKAHSQGVIHRDLKPDNIWLEPNDRGGYTVKVLDLGLAHIVNNEPVPVDDECPTLVQPPVADESGAQAPVTSLATQAVQTGTPRDTDPNDRKSTAPAGELTQAGAILGTPRYMSPEQCLGQPLSMRADIYSIGVIAYEMFAGEPPFKGDTQALIAQHVREVAVPPKEKRPEVPSGVSKLIMAALSKDPGLRPGSAIAFSSGLRANMDRTGAMLRRALVLSTEHFGILFRISLVAAIPIVAWTICYTVVLALERFDHSGVLHAVQWLSDYLPVGLFPGIVSSFILDGAAIVVVAHLYSTPLRPVQLRPIFAAVRKKWKSLVTTGLLAGLGTFLGLFAFLLPGLILLVISQLTGPVVIVEGLDGIAAIKRSSSLVNRSRLTAVAVIVIQTVIPLILLYLLVYAKIGLFGGNAREMYNPGGVTSLAFIIGNVVLGPFAAVLTSLLYLNTRGMGGETLKDVLAECDQIAGIGRQEHSSIQGRIHKDLSAIG